MTSAVASPEMRGYLATAVAAAADCLPSEVEARETHASLVLLTPQRAFKAKKPVNLGFLDYTTLELREAACQSEVVLNRRLAPAVYLGVVPVREAPGGALSLGDGPGQVVDQLVEMLRLPDEASLRALVANDAIGPAELERIGSFLGAFHKRAARSAAISTGGNLATVAANVNENSRQVAPFVGPLLDADAAREVVDWGEQVLASRPGLFADRAGAGRICDGHGDLRAEHIFPGDSIKVIDCIEFTTRFRWADQAADVAFLAMDLDALGAPDFVEPLLDSWAATAGDGLDETFPFYLVYRAFTRAKVACVRWEQANGAARQAAASEARRQLDLALRYVRGDRRPRLVLVAGLSGTGKSTLARHLGEVFPAEVVVADEVRKRAAGLEEGQQGDDALYSLEMTDRVYARLRQRAEAELARGRSVVLDATHRSVSQRAAAADLASRFSAAFLCVECTAPPAVALDRLARREASGATWSDADEAVFYGQQARFEPISELPPGSHLRLDTVQPIDQQVDAVLRKLQGFA